MTLQQLTYFLAAAEHGSFSAAAEALHMAQPSLSEQIRRLEAELGVALFARVGRGLELTEAGRLLRPARRAHARRGAPRPRSPCARCATSPAGTVAFGTFGCAHHYLLAGLRPGLPRRATRRCACARSGQNSAEVADAVRDGDLEAGLVALPVDDRGLDVRAGDARGAALHLAPTPSDVREPMTIERLAEAPLILFDARCGADDPMRRQLRERAQERRREARAARSRSSTSPPRSSSPRAGSATPSRAADRS